MIGRRRPAAPGPDPWEDEGRRLAPLFASVSSAVVVGLDADAAARVALGVALATAGERRVAVADLTGGAPSLVALAGDGSAKGVTDSFLFGVSLNEVARPAADGTPSLFILPFGTQSALPDDMLGSDRWRRLAAGFEEADALLLIVVRAETPALAALVMQTDGAVAVGNADLPLEWRVIAQAGDRSPLPSHPAPAQAARRASPRRRVIATAVLAILVVAAASLLLRDGPISRWRSQARPAPAPKAVRVTTPAAAQTPPAAVPTPDTVRVSDPVNPPDSAAAAKFAVELVATNTVSGANLWLREHGAPIPGATVSPVLLGSARTRWYKVLAGASRDRMVADSMLAALRAAGVVRAEAGMVVRVPLALLLESDVTRGAAPARVAALVGRGVPAYALLQDDGSVRLYAGAFETAAAAVPLDADLRAAGLAPQLAYRTGRTF